MQRPADIEEARRRLDKLCDLGQLVRVDGPTQTSPATYFMAELSAA